MSLLFLSWEIWTHCEETLDLFPILVSWRTNHYCLEMSTASPGQHKCVASEFCCPCRERKLQIMPYLRHLAKTRQIPKATQKQVCWRKKQGQKDYDIKLCSFYMKTSCVRRCETRMTRWTKEVDGIVTPTNFWSQYTKFNHTEKKNTQKAPLNSDFKNYIPLTNFLALGGPFSSEPLLLKKRWTEIRDSTEFRYLYGWLIWSKLASKSLS